MAIYKAGDQVRVLPYADIQRQFQRGDTLPSGCNFPSTMKELCGHSYTVIRSYAAWNGTSRYRLKGQGWVFTDEMLECAEPAFQPEMLVISFDDVMGIK